MGSDVPVAIGTVYILSGAKAGLGLMLNAFCDRIEFGVKKVVRRWFPD